MVVSIEAEVSNLAKLLPFGPYKTRVLDSLQCAVLKCSWE